MTPEQQRIAIAKACGFKKIQGPYADGGFVGRRDRDRHEIPDYTADLNAMNEAEEAAYKKDCVFLMRYRDRLCEVVGSDCPFYATAAQRAEAFLKTMNLWKE